MNDPVEAHDAAVAALRKELMECSQDELHGRVRQLTEDAKAGNLSAMVVWLELVTDECDEGDADGRITPITE